MSIRVLFIAVALLTGSSLMQPSFAKSPLQTQNNSQSVTLDMQNMTCAMCKITIRKALEGVEGVQAVKVDSDSKTASVTFDPQKTNSDALIKATTHAGYPATVRPEE